MKRPTPPIEWAGDHIRIIDQTLLPAEVKFIEIRKTNEDFFINRDTQRSKWMWNTVNLKVQEFIQNNLKNKDFVNYIQEAMKDNELGIYKASEIICDYLLKNK